MMATPLRVLIVEDNEDDAELLLRELRRGGFDPTFERVETPETMRAALERPWDVVISDWGMPRFGALHALRLMQDLERDLPFIIISGSVGEEAAVSALRAGAHDFMAKGRLTRLIPAIERELREAEMRAERRAIEQQLRRTQKMEAMGQLTGGVAHDFNNLLGVIVANADLLLEEVRGNADQEELTNDILQSALRGAELTHRLLAFARQQPLAAQIIDLNERLPPIVTLLRRTLGEGINIAARLADDLWQTRADPSQLENALLNLAINARDAMPQGGALTIETSNAQLDEHYATLHTEIVPGDYVMLALTDTGTGMAPEVLERAMEPFFTTKETGKGTGLGLSMVYGFAKQSGGHLNLYSEVGVGTTIRLYLPRAQREHDAPQATAAAAQVLPTGSEAILLVDDNAALRRATMRQLTALGYRVQEADSGPAALAIIDAGERFDLLFSDIGLPDGINGFELAEQARYRLPALKVLFTTGYGNLGAQNAEVAKPENLLRKPYTGNDLMTALRAVLAGKPES